MLELLITFLNGTTMTTSLAAQTGGLKQVADSVNAANFIESIEIIRYIPITNR